MIITTHTIFGAVLAKAAAPDYFSAFAVGFLSHFILDAIPHWDYSLNINSKKENSLKLLAKDALKLFLDFSAAALIIFLFLNTPAQTGQAVLWLGALGAIFPDVIQNLAEFKRFKFLSFFKNFHDSLHAKIELKNPLHIFSQCLLVALFLFLYSFF